MACPSRVAAVKSPPSLELLFAMVASRPRPPAGPKTRPGSPAVSVLIAFDAVRSWIIPGIAAGTLALCAGLTAAGLVPTPGGLAATVLAALALLLYIGLRPLLAGGKPRAGWPLAAALGLVWFVACYLPFHLRLFPGTPLIDAAHVTAAGGGLPLLIPAEGHGTIDLLLEGQLPTSPAGSVATPVHFTLTLEDAQGAKQLVEGTFTDQLRNRRLGRRGTAVVHETHASELHVISNPARQTVRLTSIVLDPPSAPAITVTAFAHPLPQPIILGLAAAGLLAVVLAFDRLGPVPETDGSLTLATAGTLGTAAALWTSNAVHVELRTLIGSAILGGPLGFAAGAILWWIAKRTIARPAR